MTFYKWILVVLVTSASICALNGCTDRCSDACEQNGSCNGKFCDCEPGYMGQQCELRAAAQLAGTYTVVAIRSNLDTVLNQSTITANPNDITEMYINDLHGIGPVTCTFEPLYKEMRYLTFYFSSQALGTTDTVSGDGSYNDEKDQIYIEYDLTDSLGRQEWRATFTRL